MPSLQRLRCRACATFFKSQISNFTTLSSNDFLGIIDHAEVYNCSEDVRDLLTKVTDNGDNTTANQTPSALGRIEEILYSKVVVAMCFIGLVGNILNLFVLVPRGLKYCSGRMEKFAYSGLIALALANMSFCLTTIPYGFLDDRKLYTGNTFALLFYVYNNAIINTFILASTWLTVTLAVGRYLAVCYPLRAREVMGMTCAKRSIITVMVLCVVFNIPRFFTYTVQTANCNGGPILYFRYYGYMKLNPTFDIAFTWTYFVLGIVVPLLLLIFCNSYLIYALRISRLTQTRIRATKTKETSNHMTLTLIVIILMYIILVSPAEMINFLRQQFSSKVSDAYNFAVAIVNTLQAFYFAFSFFPYCAINAHFRKTMARFLTGKCFKKERREYPAGGYKNFTCNVSEAGTTELYQV